MLLAALLLLAGPWFSGPSAQSSTSPLPTAPPPASAWVGVYIWGGLLSPSATGGATGAARLQASVRHVLDAGFDTVRIAVGPKATVQYGLDPSVVCRDDRRMGCLMRLMLDGPVWDDPRLRRVMVTAQDFACARAAENDNGCLDERLLSSNRDAILSETVDLLDVLARRFGPRGVPVILSNWEGDNFVYCGTSYDFSLKPEAAARCRLRFPPGQSNADRARAFLAWVALRDQAVAAVRARHPGFDVIQAPEFNAARQFDGGCRGACTAGTDTVLDQIAASGGRDLCSYSAYDGQGPAFAATLDRILKACRSLVLGEFGLDALKVPTARIAENFANVAAAMRQRPGVVGAVVWNAFDPSSGAQSYGLFRPDGSPHLIETLGPLRPLRPSPASR